MEKGEENSLNKSKPPQVNRGVELILRNKRRKPLQKPKTFNIMFGNMIALWNREIHFHFEISLDIKKII
jgi:hypothetical protein